MHICTNIYIRRTSHNDRRLTYHIIVDLDLTLFPHRTKTEAEMSADASHLADLSDCC